jgi:hypothetical protein
MKILGAGSKFAIHLCKLCGLDPNMTRDLTVYCPADDVVIIETMQYVGNPTPETIAEIETEPELLRYRLVEIEDVVSPVGDDDGNDP